MARRDPEPLLAGELAHERAAVEATAGARRPARPSTLARRRPGTKRSPARLRMGAQAAASGRSARNVEPTETCPSAGTRLKIDAVPPAPTASTPASSSTCRGGPSISISATTPHTGTIGCQARVGSITSGVQGPAATSTAPAGRRTPAASTPWRARRSPTARRSRPRGSGRPRRRRAWRTLAWPRRGAPGSPVSSRQPQSPGRTAGSSGRSSPARGERAPAPGSPAPPPSRTARAPRARARASAARPALGQLEVGQLAVVAERLDVQPSAPGRRGAAPSPSCGPTPRRPPPRPRTAPRARPPRQGRLPPRSPRCRRR